MAKLSEIVRGMPRQQVERALALTAQAALDYAHDAADGHRKSGGLARSLDLRKISALEYEIGHDTKIAPHFRYVHWGTRPHLIKPKAKKALRWPSGGRFIFAKSVRHPGYAGDPWLVRTINQVPDNFSRFLAEALP